ncbi:thiamine diphosphate-binding protein [Podospora fimiseda]|uniref:Pyruvate decarboxylase n=1 Tax=Podospora fimiseda TaxID=252190 RepID=A0AAN7H025_9PEZI|nr:thiamine diphosphate-binding protein [Podospora fimiseda]
MLKTTEILIGDYLFLRLKQLGIETVFGVPGDYELALLDLVEPLGLKWIGTPNELIGAYAADGYARINGAGALVTTFGPGELSALCGIGGSYCESVPIVHIVGYPKISLQKTDKILHHTLGDGRYDRYQKISSELSCATTVLDDYLTAASEIDRVLTAMMYHSKPGYIGISEDIAYAKIPSSSLNTPIPRTLSPPAPEVQAPALSAIINTLQSSKVPVLMIDGGAARSSWAQYVNPLINTLKIPFFVTGMGKGIADESSPYYQGCYAGDGSYPATVIDAVEAADCILWLGNFPADFNTGMFTQRLTNKTIIDLQRFSLSVNDTKYDNAPITFILPSLTKSLPPLPSLPSTPLSLSLPPLPSTSSPITHDLFFPLLSPFLRPTDIIITETGTVQVGITLTHLPPNSLAWTQQVYGSIGYAAAAAAGASVAALHPTSAHNRIVLITGEGSLQLSIQSLSLFRRVGVPVVVFILNNKGYTIERFFRGWEAGYNDVADWDYLKLFEGFAPATEGEKEERELLFKGYRVKTLGELEDFLGDGEKLLLGKKATCVEVIVGKEDAVEPLKRTFKSASEGGGK